MYTSYSFATQQALFQYGSLAADCEQPMYNPDLKHL